MTERGHREGRPCRVLTMLFACLSAVPYFQSRDNVNTYLLGLLGLTVTIHGIEELFNTCYLLLLVISLRRKERPLSGMEGSWEEGCSGLFHSPGCWVLALSFVVLGNVWAHLTPPIELLVGVQGLSGSFIACLSLLVSWSPAPANPWWFCSCFDPCSCCCLCRACLPLSSPSKVFSQ